ncbi:ABC transporter permease [Acaryochloris sp. 'Moss Beach']|uniref:cell division protein FtsX n=1 Tax=Acaryochloris TaxID=155977 RepID=UPI001BAEE7AC|nr:MULTISPECIES: permease-like cell division protein FtsX [Acaryochloris]QUY41651.1 ABC transporter permease [Acaryochloris marina S15]UJB70812.1 ABC transporter permease [Acaryochloris sp. 'Moss Beach']
MRSHPFQVPEQLKVVATKLTYLLQETGRGLKRGGWMNWAAISTVTVLLFLLGISLQTSWQVSGLLNNLGSRFEVAVYLKPEATGAQLKSSISQFPDVSSIEVIPKDQAWKELLADLGTTDIAGATEGLGENPLVDALKVQAKSAIAVPTLAKKIARLRGVETVQYLDEALKNLTQLNRGFSQISLGVVALLTLTAIAVITTTIRLIVVARNQEIEVMKLVGATTSWIYFPFVLQGITFGLVGAVIAWIFIVVTRQLMRTAFAQQPTFLQTLGEGLQLTPWQVVVLPLILLGFGSVVGIIGSLFAVRRFASK